MRKGMKLYYARAKEIGSDETSTCAFIANNDEVADKKARKFFNEIFYYYEFEVNEQEIPDDNYEYEYYMDEIKDMKANEYYDTPYNYTWCW